MVALFEALHPNRKETENKSNRGSCVLNLIGLWYRFEN